MEVIAEMKPMLSLEFLNWLRSLEPGPRPVLARIEREARARWSVLREQLSCPFERGRVFAAWRRELERLNGGRSPVGGCFERVGSEDLPRPAQPWSEKPTDGVFYETYPDGQLKRLARYREGQRAQQLLLEYGRAQARWEGEAYVAELHEDNTLEEYGARYERCTLVNQTFRQWVLQTIEEVFAA